MKKIFLGLTAIIALLILALGVRLFWLAQKSPSIVRNDLGVEQGHLKSCDEKPNCVSSAAKPDSEFFIEPLLSENIEGVWDDLNMLINELVKDKKRWDIRNEQENYIHIIAISKIFGFVDDVEFHMIPEEGVIEMRSQSRVGHSDMGVNRKRMEWFRDQLQPKN